MWEFTAFKRKLVKDSSVLPCICLDIKIYLGYSITCALSALVHWLGAHQCKISWKLHLNTSNTDLQTMMQNIVKFAASQTRSILTKQPLKHPCWSLFYNRPAALWKKRLQHSILPLNSAKCLRTPFLQHTSGRLLLSMAIYTKSI